MLKKRKDKFYEPGRGITINLYLRRTPVRSDILLNFYLSVSICQRNKTFAKR